MGCKDHTLEDGLNGHILSLMCARKALRTEVRRPHFFDIFVFWISTWICAFAAGDCFQAAVSKNVVERHGSEAFLQPQALHLGNSALLYQGLLLWLFQMGFKLSLGTVKWH